MSPRFLPLAAIVLLAVCGTAAQAIATFQGSDLSRSTGELWYFAYSFMFFAWPVLAPYYLFQSRHWRGLAVGVALIILSIAPDLASMAVYHLWGDE